MVSNFSAIVGAENNNDLFYFSDAISFSNAVL
jgi:hypothetical protein